MIECVQVLVQTTAGPKKRETPSTKQKVNLHRCTRTTCSLSSVAATPAEATIELTESRHQPLTITNNTR